MSMLKNVEVMWTCIQQPDTKFEHIWRTDVIVSPEQRDELQKEAKALYSEGFNFRKDDKDNIIFRVKRKVTRSDGEMNKAPVCKGTKRDKDTGALVDVKDLIGNGSICNIHYEFYPWDNSFGKGVNADFKGLQVVKLVSYGVLDGDCFDEIEEAKGKEEYDEEDFT